MLSGLVAGVRLAARALIVLRARDVTALRARRTALVLAPHPDDETLGCGARIRLAIDHGRQVTVVVATDGAMSAAAGSMASSEVARLRAEELSIAMAYLGVAPGDVVQLGHPDGSLELHHEALVAELTRLLRDRAPDDVYAPCLAESHPDHHAAARALREAASRVSPQPRLLEYPIWLWADWPFSRHRGLTGIHEAWLYLRSRRVEIVRVDAVRDEKRRALAAFVSQLGEDGLPEQLVRRALQGPEVFFVEDLS